MNLLVFGKQHKLCRIGVGKAAGGRCRIVYYDSEGRAERLMGLIMMKGASGLNEKT